MKHGETVTMAIIYLFDDENFSAYISDKVLRKKEREHQEDSKASDDCGNMSEDEDEKKEEIEVSDWEI